MSAKSELQVPHGTHRIQWWAAVILLVVWFWILFSHNSSLSIYHLLLLLIFGAVGFLPTFVAGIRHHRNGLAIFVLNLLLFGALVLTWLFSDLIANLTSVAPLLAAVGWIIALVWSFTARRLE
jgi:FtsH-binding integral membrane protein